MGYSSRFWYDLWREGLWNRSLSCIVATTADASMDPDLIHQTEGCKMALFVRTFVGKTLWVFLLVEDRTLSRGIIRIASGV